MADHYAYIVGEHLRTALDEHVAALAAHRTRVESFDESHPHAPTDWGTRPGAHDPWMRGFVDTDPHRTPPDGLSRAAGRRPLIPRRGPHGDYWRDAWADLISDQPSLDTLLLDFQIPVGVYDVAPRRVWDPVQIVRGGPGQTYLSCRSQLSADPHPHLTAVQLSRYYLAVEQAEVTAP